MSTEQIEAIKNIIDASMYSDWFKYCHIALDRYTYNGYRLPFYKKIVYPCIHGCTAPEFDSWSNISIYSDYQIIVDDIVSYVSAHPKTYNDYVDICVRFPTLPTISKLAEDYILTPFEAEFFIWIIAKACMKKNSAGKYVYPSSFVRDIENLF